jgi:hypothetical protein
MAEKIAFVQMFVMRWPGPGQAGRGARPLYVPVTATKRAARAGNRLAGRPQAAFNGL